MTTSIAYKVFTGEQWASFQRDGLFLGAPIDLADGYIHMSSADQLQGTLDKYFADQSGVVVAQIDLTQFGSELKWERSRGDAFFPHLYAPLPMSSVVSTRDA